MYIVYNAYVNPKYSTTKLDSYKALLNYLSQFNVSDFTRTHNTFLDKVGHNANDVYTDIPRFKYCSGTINIEYHSRLNRITDEDGNSIFCKQLVKDVLKTSHDKEQGFLDLQRANKTEEPKGYYLGHRLVLRSSMPGFRSGPIPFTGGGYRSYNFWRHCKHIGARKQNVEINILDEIIGTDVENVDIPVSKIRGMRKKYVDNLPDGWIEERMEDWHNTNWKRHNKNRKQWENKVKTRHRRKSKKVYVAKQSDKWDIIEEINMCA